MSKLFEGPAGDHTCGTPTTKPTGSVVKNGEPGYQKRTNSSRAMDEVTYSNGNRLKKGTK